MISAYKATKANKNLKSIIQSYKDSYRSLCQSSRTEYLESLPAYSKVPEGERLYTDAARNEFAQRCYGYRHDAEEIINNVLSDLKDEATKAPDADAVNVVSLLKMRDKVSGAELDDLLTRYGKDNPQIWAALKDIGTANGIHTIPDHPVNQAIEDVERLGDSLYRALTSPISSFASATPDGLFSFIEEHIDATFPVDHVYE